ncbi:hypothetical protein MJI12_26020, partial [Salmonella enterica subsp. enterica serovar Kentucky]|nr:hypothetical protein [Salmonella enterica subsp. enterica serovar Kentucky]
IGEFHKQGSAFYFALLDPEEKEIIGVANFSNVVRGSFHACYLSENYHLLNHAAFDQMKNGVMVINTSRGALIDSQAAIEALKNQ